MTEFGHIGIRMVDGFMDAWGVGPFVIEVDGKRYRFEDSDRFGPSRVNKDGEISKNPFFAKYSPFWIGWRKWRDQGRKVAEDGETCLWQEVNDPQ